MSNGIRILATEDDFRQSSLLSATAFSYILTDDPKREYKPSPGVDVWGFFEGDRLVSQIASFHYEMLYHGRYEAMCGIGDVCSLIESRNKGHIRALFDAILAEERKNGCSFSYLYPFSHRYYAQFGYTPSVNKQAVHIPTVELRGFDCTCDAVMYRPGDSAEPYARVFEAFASRYTGMVRRPNWKRLEDYTPAKNLKYMHLFSRKGQPVAFLGYRLASKEPLTVIDAAWTDPAAFRDLLGFLYRLRHHVDNCEFAMPIDIPMDQLVAEPGRGMKRTRFTAGQLRILDVPLALERYPWPEQGGSLVLAVRDESFGDNNGVFTVAYGNGSATVTRDGSAPALELDIRALNPLLLGNIGFSGLGYLDPSLVTVHGDPRGLAGIFTERPTYITEGF